MTSANDGDTSALDDDWDVGATPKTDAAETVSSPVAESPAVPLPSTPAAHDSTDPSGGRAAESPRDQGPPWARRLALAAVILGLLGVAVSTVRALVRPKAQDPEPGAVTATTPAGITTTPAAAPTASTVQPADTPSATPQAAVTSSSEKEARPRPTASQRFDSRAARAALNALAPTLTDCRIPNGRSGKVEVVFEPDGHVSAARPLDLYVGTFGGRCVATHLKKATVPAFWGEATAYTHVFIIPE